MLMSIIRLRKSTAFWRLAASGLTGRQPARRALATLDVCLAAVPGGYVVDRLEHQAFRVERFDAESEEFELTDNPVLDMMQTLYLTNSRANRYTDQRYRLEDLPPREDPTRYVHVKHPRPLEELWEEMWNLDHSLCHALKVQATNYGY